jgi:hypothetical protein
MAAEADNLTIQQQINAVLSERSRMLDAQASRIADQVELALQLCKALKCEEVDRTVERLEEMRRSLASVGKAATDTTDGLRGGLDDTAKASAKVSADVNKGFSKMKASALAFGSAVVDAGKFVSNLALAIIGLPLRTFDIITEKAGELAGNTAVFDAMEDIREQFGDINEGFAKQVVEGADSIAASLAKSGRTIADTFGVGPEGKAAALRASAEVAAALGDTAVLLGKDFGDAAGDLFMLQRGMGLTGEDMKGLVVAAKVTGKNVGELAGDIQKLSKAMAGGMNVKAFAKDMTYMLTNTAKYGKLSATQVAATVAYVKNLGLEVKQIESLNEAFDDFEGAATASAKLAQSFGMQVDAMQMMKEQDPGKRLEMLRASFAATGKSIESMTRAEKQLLASSSGLSAEIVEQALSTNNAGKSYDELNKNANDAEKKQKSQQQMFEELGNSIKKMTEALSYSGGFFNNFIQGIGEGIMRSGPMRVLLRDIAGALRTIRMAGREVAKMFVEMFPGIKDMLGALHDFFKASNFKKTINEFKDAIKKFFEDLQKDPKKALENFTKTVKEKFSDLFDKNSPAGKKFMEGADKFFKTVGVLIAAGVKIIAENLAAGLRAFADFIRNPDKMSGDASGMGASFFGPIIESFKDAIPTVLSALLDSFKALVPKLGPAIGALLAVGLAASITMGLVSAGVEGIKAAASEIVKNKVMSMFTNALTPPMPPPGAAGGTSALQDLGAGIKGFIGEIVGIKASDILEATLKLVLLAAMMTVGGVAFVAGLALVGAAAMAIGIEAILVGMAAVTAGALAAYATAQIASKINPGMIGQAAVGLLAGAALMLVAIPFIFTASLAARVAAGAPLEAYVALGLALAVGAGALAVAVYAFTALAAAFNPAAFALVGAGLLAATALIVLTPLFLIAYSEVAKAVASKMDFGAIALFTAAAVLVFGGMAIIAYGAAAAGLASVAGLAGAGLLVLAGVPMMAALSLFMIGYSAAASAANTVLDMGAITLFTAALLLTLASVAAISLFASVAGGASLLGATGALLLMTAGVAMMMGIGEFMTAVADAAKSSPDTKAISDYILATSLVSAESIIISVAAGVAGSASAYGFLGSLALSTAGVEMMKNIGAFMETVNKIASDIPTNVDAMNSFTLATSIVLVETATLGALALVAGAAVGYGLVGAIALGTAGPIFFKMLGDFVGKLVDSMKTISTSSLANAATNMRLIAITVGELIVTMGLVAAAGIALIAASWYGFLGDPIKKGFSAITGFLTDIKELFLPPLDAFKSVKVPDKEISKIIGLVADLLQGMGPAIEVFMAVSKQSGGIFESASSQADATSKMMESLGGFINTISASASFMLGVIIEAAKGLTVDDSLKTRFDMVAKAVEIIGNLLGGMTGALKSLPKIEAGEDDTVAEVAAAFVTSLTSMKENLFGPGGMMDLLIAEVPGIVNKIMGITIPGDMKAMKEKIELISSVIQAFATMAKTLADLQKLIPNETKQVVEKGIIFDETRDVVEQNINGFAPLMNTLIDAFSPQLGKLVAAFLAIPIPAEVKEMQAQAKKIYIVMNTFSDLAKIIGEVPLQEIGEGAPKTESFADAVSRIVDGGDWMAWGVTTLAEYIDSYGGGPSPGFIPAYFKSAEQAFTAIGVGIEAMMKTSGNVKAFSGDLGESIVTDVVKITENINELDRMMKNVNIPKINATVRGLADALLVDRPDIRIENKPINIHMQMELKLDAEEITKAVLRTTAKLRKRNNVTADEALDPDSVGFKSL